MYGVIDDFLVGQSYGYTLFDYSNDPYSALKINNILLRLSIKKDEHHIGCDIHYHTCHIWCGSG